MKDRQFVIKASWVTKTGIEDFEQAYTVSSVFKSSGPKGVVLRKKHCRYADDFIRQVLIARGVIT
jgi:hypothetical protein